MSNLIKNPILIGFIIATMVFIYLKWKVDKKNKKTGKNKEVNLMIPLAVGVVGTLFSFYYFSEMTPNYQAIPQQIVQNLPQVESAVDSIKSFHLIGRGVNMPQNFGGEYLDI